MNYLLGTGNNFNPRPPWGGRPPKPPSLPPLVKFQSTPSVGRATALVFLLMLNMRISIHALRGEGDVHAWKVGDGTQISIHALRGEGDENI